MFKKNGISCGMFLLPVIPFITDTPSQIENSIKKAKQAGVDFIIFGGMTLKDGKQKEYFLNQLRQYYPDQLPNYNNIYKKGDRWGSATSSYYNSINETFNKISKKYQIPRRIPHVLYKEVLDENDLVIVILEHIDYLLKLEGKKSFFGYAAYNISKIDEPISKIQDLSKIKGVGKITENVILEIIDTGTSKYYEKLMK